MLDYQHIVDDVRSSLDSQDIDGMDFLRAAAADYSVACDEVNERLRKCAMLLRRGLRSEAIQLCEMEPNLLDAVAVLDFPEREQWLEVTEQSGMAPLPPLMLDAAADLNEAYSLEQPLAELLKKHRLLALCYGGLSSRIRVLRQLASLDAGNDVWQKDLHTFELERHKQIEAEASAARRAGDPAALKALEVELASPQWDNPPSAALIKSVAEMSDKVGCAVAQEQLNQLSTELAAALADSNVDGAMALRDRWNGIIAETGFPPNDEIAGRAAPALDWLGQQDERRREEEERREALASHKRALGVLTQALVRNASVAELQEMFRCADALGGVPFELEARYQARVLAIQHVARRRRWMKLSGIATGCGLAAVAILVGIFYVLGQQAVASAVKSIPAMIEAGELEQAAILVKSLPPHVAQDARVREVIVRLDAEVKKEERRNTAFTTQLTATTRWAENLRKSLLSEQTQAALDGFHEELDRIQKELSQVAKNARATQELVAANAAREAANQLEKQWQQRIDDAFLLQCEEFDKRLTTIAGDKEAVSETTRSRLAEVKKSLKKWENVSDHVSSALSPRIKTFYDRLAAIDKRSQQQDNEEQGLKRIASAVEEPAHYLQVIQDFVQQNPDSNHTPEFKRVIQEAAFWDAVKEWNKLVEPWNRSGVAGLTPATAKKQREAANGIVELFAELPDRDNLRQLLAYMEAVARRTKDDERIDAPLRKMFGDPLVADISFIEKVGGERYYVNAEPKLDGDRPRPFKYVVGFDGKEKGGLMRKDDVKSFGPSPQAALAKQVQTILHSLEDATWEKSFCRMIAVIAKDRETDSILKARLLQKALDIGCRGSYCMEKPFGNHLQWFRDAKIDLFANWLDPLDPAVADARKEAARKLEGFPDIEGPTKAVGQSLAELRKLRLTEYHWIGALQKEETTGWKCVMKHTPDASGSLVVICRQAQGARPAFQTIGRLDAKGATINAIEPGWLLEGRPVYLATP